MLILQASRTIETKETLLIYDEIEISVHASIHSMNS